MENQKEHKKHIKSLGKRFFFIKSRIRQEILKIRFASEEQKVRRISQNEVQPIYHLHIRKTGGTSINNAFLSYCAPSSPEETLKRLELKPNHQLVCTDKVFVGWNKHLINRGRFSYAFSHIPLHQLSLPEKCFVFTSFRDPLDRLISHYNMLLGYQANKIKPDWMKVEGQWLGKSFDNFLDNIPKPHLLNQMYMFSNSYSIDECLNKANSLNHILFLDSIQADLKTLSQKTEWPLILKHSNKRTHKATLTDSEKGRAREMLTLEYDFLDKLGQFLLNKDVKR